MKLKPDAIVSLFIPMINETGRYLLPISADKLKLEFIVDAKERAALLQVAGVLLGAIRAVLELHSVYEDIVTSYRMARRYPWRGSKITRSQHLQFVWVQFINQCYLFREKYKLSASNINSAKKIFKLTPAITLGVVLKEIDKALGKFIRMRGQHFHEWYEHNKHVQFFSMIELINSAKRPDGPFGDVEGHYRDAKMMLGWEIESAGESVEAILKGTVRDQINELTKILKKYNRWVDRANEKAKSSS